MSFLSRLLAALVPENADPFREERAPPPPPARPRNDRVAWPDARAQENQPLRWRGGDTLSAIQDLTSILSSHPNAPDAAEVSLALGSLFRAKGDIDRAVTLREGILSRPGLEEPFRARTFFELGLDYRRAGLLDRALMSFQESRKHGFPEHMVQEELAQLHADSGNFKAASETFSLLGHKRAEAYFLVRHAEETAAEGNDKPALALVQKAIEAYPGSPEAWLALASMHFLARDAGKTVEYLSRGLSKTDEPGRLILLQGLYALCEASFPQGLGVTSVSDLVSALTKGLQRQKPDLLLHYYGGLFLLHAGERQEAEQWLTKALVLKPDFWATRLVLLQLASQREELSPLLEGQLDYFLRVVSRVKRFVCTPCGMRLETIFSRCPRCLAWHSVAFRMSLN